MKKASLERRMRDFPGGPVVKNPSSSAGDVGLIPGWEIKIQHATTMEKEMATHSSVLA